MFTVASLFTKNDGDPATGLTLADIDLYLYRRVKATGVVSTVWNGVNPTEEIGGGLYGRAYTSDDTATYDYFAYAQYTGVTVLDTNYALQNAPTAVDIANTVWNEASTTHVTAGTFGATLHGNIAQSGDSYLRIGSPAGASVSADVAAIKAETAAIVADTSELQVDWMNGGRLDLLIDTILADTTSLNDTVLAEITGILDVPATPTIRQAIMLLYMAVRNNSQSTATERRILNDAGTEVLDATMSDDGTTFSQGKLTAP